MNRLPVRLKAIADQLSPGASVADIGLDHALLSIYLVASGRSPRLIGVENQAGPYLKAQEAVQTAGLGAQIELRFGSGLSPIEPGEVDEVVIAGMGGETIVGILETELARASSIRRFIFQPMTRPECLRAFLGAQGWPIIKKYWKNRAIKRDSAYTVSIHEIELFLATPNTTESEIDARELAKMIEEFLDMQTTENRVIFLRRYWFSDSYKDIAEVVGLSEKNVSVRLTRIREKMKQYLIEREVFI